MSISWGVREEEGEATRRTDRKKAVDPCVEMQMGGRGGRGGGWNGSAGGSDSSDSSREPDVQEEEESAAHPTWGSGASSVGLDRKSQEPLTSRKQGWPSRPCSHPPPPCLCSLGFFWRRKQWDNNLQELERRQFSEQTQQTLTAGWSQKGPGDGEAPVRQQGAKRQLVPRRDGPVGPGKRDSDVLEL